MYASLLVMAAGSISTVPKPRAVLNLKKFSGKLSGNRAPNAP